ncbi:MAG: BolA/IbaG family iron-sulfur metabolism protein [Planctomycetota bacterium]|jgi:stress-induced morphogen|nr:BolA/IbaG family iron-sulfur metabolism protein [Planctomycetota bacterium]
MEASAVEKIVMDGLEGASCVATDLTGTMDHWNLQISWAGFQGLSLLEQHRKVLDVMRPYMSEGDNTVHAVQIKTTCPTAS